MKILKIRAMAIVLDMPMTKEENWNSVFPATVMATFIPGYLPFFAIRKRNVAGWLESYILKDLLKNRLEMSLSRFTASTIPSPAISRMVDSVRTQVNAWLERSLESYYPVMFVDCVHIKIHRKRSVSSEAFYVALAVTEEGRRDVLAIFNIPTESATGWSDIFDTLKERSVQKIGLMVADGIKGLDVVVGEKFPGTPLQRCVTHLKRNMFANVSHGDKGALASDLRDIFRTGQRDYTIEMAWKKWQDMCERWGKDYRAFKLMRNNADYKAYMTYLNYAPEIQSMIYTTNWIERLNRDFRRVTRMRTAMPNEESVLTLMGSVAMEHKAFDRLLPYITCDKTLFPD